MEGALIPACLGLRRKGLFWCRLSPKRRMKGEKGGRGRSCPLGKGCSRSGSERGLASALSSSEREKEKPVGEKGVVGSTSVSSRNKRRSALGEREKRRGGVTGRGGGVLVFRKGEMSCIRKNKLKGRNLTPVGYDSIEQRGKM